MSLLPAEVSGALQQLLQALQSNDNTIRSQAEDQLNNDWNANRPDVLLMGLAEQIQVGHDNPVGTHRPVYTSTYKIIDPLLRCSPIPPPVFEDKKGPRRLLARTLSHTQCRRTDGYTIETPRMPRQ